MNLVIVESPYAGNVDLNVEYARACLADCLKRGEAPFASHLLYTQQGVLDDNDPKERAKGMEAGFAWRAVMSIDRLSQVIPDTVVYLDLGISGGMIAGMEHAQECKSKIVFRKLGGDWADRAAARKAAKQEIPF